MRVSLRNNNGFSLVELMVVVAIIGILAMIAVPNFQRFTAKSKQSEARSNLAALYQAQRAFQAEWQSFFADFRNIGYDPVGQLRYRHGFGAPGVALPGNYTGLPLGAGGTAQQYNTQIYCAGGGGGAGKCSEITTPVAPQGLNGANTTTNTPEPQFTAEANGDIDGDTTVDRWTMNHLKVLTQVTDDINQ